MICEGRTTVIQISYIVYSSVKSFSLNAYLPYDVASWVLLKCDTAILDHIYKTNKQTNKQTNNIFISKAQIKIMLHFSTNQSNVAWWRQQGNVRYGPVFDLTEIDPIDPVYELIQSSAIGYILSVKRTKCITTALSLKP